MPSNDRRLNYNNRLFILLLRVSSPARLNPDLAVGIVARRRKPKRNTQLERFVAKGQPVFNFVISLHSFRHCSKDLQAVVDGYCKFWVKRVCSFNLGCASPAPLEMMQKNLPLFIM
jgi:hypothetical protein